jgi:hypothetical protein
VGRRRGSPRLGSETQEHRPPRSRETAKWATCETTQPLQGTDVQETSTQDAVLYRCPQQGHPGWWHRSHIAQFQKFQAGFQDADAGWVSQDSCPLPCTPQVCWCKLRKARSQVTPALPCLLQP